MKKVIAGILMMFVMTMANASPLKPMAAGSGGVSAAAIIPVAALVASVMYDKEQACDHLPVKTEKAANGNYSYAVAGCDQ